MGFSIGKFLGAIAPVVGAVFGGAPGAALGTAVGAAILGPPKIAPAGFVAPAQQISFVPAPRPGGSSVGPTAASASILLPLARGAGRLISSLLARASATLGKRINRAGVLSLTREVGIVAAATALGLTAVEVAQIIAAKPTRRRRGITASQITTTKATMRRLDSLNRAIASACPPPRRRRAPSRAAIHHAK